MNLPPEPHLSPEVMLVYSCLVPPGVYETPNLLEGTPDWALVAGVAQAQEVFPLVYRRLAPALPPPEQAAWKALYQANARRNLRLARALLQVLDLLDRRAIPCLTLKGPALALQAYGDLSLRSFVDLDVLVRPADFAAVSRAVLAAGWVPEFKLTPKHVSWLLRTHDHLPFFRDGIILEVHWHIFGPGFRSASSLEKIWQAPAHVQLLERQIRTLSPHNAFLLACLHAAKHNWTSLKLAADAARCLEACAGMDWPAFFAWAGRKGLRRILCLGLLLAQDPGGARLDGWLAAEARRDHQALALAAAARRRILAQAPAEGEIARAAFYLRCRERLRDRLYYLFDQLFIPKEIDWLTLDLPARLYFLYIPLRPLRLAAKFARALLLRKTP